MTCTLVKTNFFSLGTANVKYYGIESKGPKCLQSHFRKGYRSMDSSVDAVAGNCDRRTDHYNQPKIVFVTQGPITL